MEKEIINDDGCTFDDIAVEGGKNGFISANFSSLVL